MNTTMHADCVHIVCRRNIVQASLEGDMVNYASGVRPYLVINPFPTHGKGDYNLPVACSIHRHNEFGRDSVFTCGYVQKF